MTVVGPLVITWDDPDELARIGVQQREWLRYLVVRDDEYFVMVPLDPAFARDIDDAAAADLFIAHKRHRHRAAGAPRPGP